MPDSNLNTSISAMRSSILTALPTATISELIDFSRIAKGLNLSNDDVVETAINDRALSLVNAGATQEEIVKISSAIKSVLNPAILTLSTSDVSNVSSSLIPDTDITYDLGSTSNKWKDIYLDGSTIDLDGKTISAAATGIEIDEVLIGTGTNKVKLTATIDGKLEQTGTDSNGVTAAPKTTTSSTSTVTNFSDLTSIGGPSVGQSILVTSTNKIYIFGGTGWYLIAEVTNESPTAITGLNATYELDIDGTATTITLVSTDPEGSTLTWSHSITAGTLGSTATITNVDNVFTITPSTTEADAGIFSVTFSATDGINGAVSAVSAFTLDFSPPIYDTIQTISNPSATPDGDAFGYAVDVNNSGTMVIGAYSAGTLPWPTGTPAGKAYIYDNTGSLVSTLANPSPGGVGPGTGLMDWFGTHVSIGNYIAVTAQQDDYSGTYTDTGAVYIFSTSGSYLRQIANPQPNESQLRDVKMSGNYALIGNSGYNLGGYTGIDGTWHSGAVYVYNAGNGSLTRTIMNPNPYGTVQLDYFGYSIAVDGNKLMVYAHGEDDAAGDIGGSVYVYNNFLSGGPDHTITNPNPYGTRPSDNFGNYMDIYGNYAVISAYGEDDSDGTNVGSAYIYETTNWTVLHTLVNPNPDGVTANDYFGRGVAISSEYCFVSADEGSTGGVVYVYKNSTGEFMTKIENPNSYDTSIGDSFGRGHSIAVSDNGDYLVVGAAYEDAASGTSAGATHLITSSNANPPVSITGVNSTYEIVYSDSALVITAISSDPEGSALTWSYSISGLTNNEATVSQSGNVFTVTPSGLISNLGTFALTIKVTDGDYIVTQTTNITIATAAPSAIAGLNAAYVLNNDGTATTITLVSTDPEGSTLTWSHSITAGTLGNTATITNVDNVFTITPSTTKADAGTFSVTFSASDGIQATTSVSAFTLVFDLKGNLQHQVSNIDTGESASAHASFSSRIAVNSTHTFVGNPDENAPTSYYGNPNYFGTPDNGRGYIYIYNNSTGNETRYMGQGGNVSWAGQSRAGNLIKANENYFAYNGLGENGNTW